jgi:HK97 family phage prohead protease
MNREHRTFQNMEIRTTEETGPNGRPVISLRAIKPGVVDDYGSLWNPRTFDGRMESRTAADAHDTPTLCWAHDWADPIGHGIGYRSDAEGPFVDFELDDFDAVPRARQADAQVRSRTIRDCSVGFSNVKRRPPTEDETRAHPGIREVIEEADLDEVSLVLRGAVPGAKVLAIRSSNGQRRQVSEAFLKDLAREVESGTMTKAQALVAIDLAAGETAEAPPAPTGEENEDDTIAAAELAAEVDEALADLDAL